MATTDERVYILAPTGQDAALIAAAIVEAPYRTVERLEDLCDPVRRHAAAAIVIAEEAITDGGIGLLNQALESQDAWSDVPIILMTTGGDTTFTVLRAKKAFSPSGNLTLLERPFRRITLQSVVDVALRARRKQHEVRTLLVKQLEATRVRDEFISIASHELKTPLTTLKLQAQISQRLLARGELGARDPERIRSLVESTVRQVDRLTRLVEDMLDVSRINTGRLTLQPETMDLAPLVRDVVERLTPQLSAARCPITTHADASITGDWDRYRIEQVLTNLLVNVARHCPGAPVSVSLDRSERRATLTVEDKGKGIAAEDQERIFQRFEHAGGTKGTNGLGLGLYISRQIVEAHGGRIWAENMTGPDGQVRGARLSVALPEAPR